jgi:hypothetical protein
MIPECFITVSFLSPNRATPQAIRLMDEDDYGGYAGSDQFILTCRHLTAACAFL